ncbi:MAG: tyrosine-type recombinase/integrase [Sedimenticola sp.]
MPAARGPEDTWFACAPLGVNQLRGTVARLCMEAGLKGFRTNHSLRATAATRLYQAGLDEQLVCEITGHRSETVREYKRTDLNMKRHASAVINATAQTSGEQDDRKRICLEQHPTPLNITINLNMKPQ